MSKTLVIAEKPSVAADLARALGKFEKHAEYFENDDYVISSAVGHLLEIVPPDGFEPTRGKWSMEHLPALPPQFALQPIEKNKGRLNVLAKLIKRKDVSRIINACDAGREGELIFRNIVRATVAKQPMSRLWLQSMTADAIRNAFLSLRSDQEMQPLADAAISRSEADWLVGINSTRALTAFNTKAIGGFQKTTAGRVQTPTLAILAEREERIRSFVSRPYFEVYGDFGVQAGTYRGRWFDPAFKKGADEDAKAERIWNREKADAIEQKCKDKPGRIEEEKKAATQAPPLLYDLTTLQREANQRFSMPARMTLQVAQALYERHKVLTYPRTDSRYLPEDYIPSAAKVMGSLSGSLAIHAQKALSNNWVRPNKRIFNNAKVSDHFAIVPTGVVPGNLDDAERKIYDLVARRFVAVFFPTAEFEITTRITIVEEERFKTEGKIITKSGWLEVYGRQAESEEENDKAIVPVRAGEIAATQAIEVKECVTKPPPRFTEATLLSAMEGAGKLIDDEELRGAMAERGLGTPATRAQIIEGLLSEGYLLRQGRDLFVTQKGISLITLLRDLDAATLTKPELTGEWESKLRKMERDELSREDFMMEIRKLTADLVEKVREGMGREIQGHFSPLMVPCPKCHSEAGFAETYRMYTCMNPECKFAIWKIMASREFEREEVSQLLTTNRVGPLEGFKSKLGRPFSAGVTILPESNPDNPGVVGEMKQRFDFANEGGEGAGEPVNAEPIGLCRVCHTGQVFEYARSFACENHAGKKCAFSMGKTILQRELPRSQIAILLKEGKTGLIDKFVSQKTKRTFSAFLKLDESNKVGFEFAPRTGDKKGPAKKPWAKPAPADGAPASESKEKKAPAKSTSAKGAKSTKDAKETKVSKPTKSTKAVSKAKPPVAADDDEAPF